LLGLKVVNCATRKENVCVREREGQKELSKPKWSNRKLNQT